MHNMHALITAFSLDMNLKMMWCVPNVENTVIKVGMVGKTVPRKVLRHFPIITLICNLFQCKSLTKIMDWQAKKKSRDKIMRIPANCGGFKCVEDKWTMFINEPHNIKMGISLDGVNPLSIQNTQYSVCPVIVINYNIPPYMSIGEHRQHDIVLVLFVVLIYMHGIVRD